MNVIFAPHSGGFSVAMQRAEGGAMKLREADSAWKLYLMRY